MPTETHILFSTAQKLVDSGISIIPIRHDGSKAPAIASWKPYQEKRATMAELKKWFGNDPEVGIGIIGGKVSENLEALDFDEVGLLDEYLALAAGIGLGAVLDRLPIVRTPSGGCHIYWRSAEPPPGNLKLAYNKNKQIRIETRGEGGYALVPPTPAACHPDNRPYVYLRGDLSCVPTISAQQREDLIALARTFNEWVTPEVIYRPSSQSGTSIGSRPGDDFNARGEAIPLLQSAGWQVEAQHGEKVLLRRPGKNGSGSTSGTYNYGGSGLFYVFSSNAAPFESEKAYSLFSVYALLRHGGDFKSAAKQLGEEGYGTPLPPSDCRNHFPHPAPEPIPPPVFLDISIAEKLHKDLLGADKVRRWLTEHCGWTLETLRRFQVGVTRPSRSESEWRICFPVFDRQGRLTNIRKHLFGYKPSLTNVRRRELGKTLSWQPGLWSDLYPLSALEGARECLVVEGEVDALVACQKGVAAITGTSGAGMWHEHWTKELAGLDRVTILYDVDRSGQAGAQKIASSICSVVPDVRMVRYAAWEEGAAQAGKDNLT